MDRMDGMDPAAAGVEHPGSSGRVMALLGAECTGKTALAEALAHALPGQGAGRCTWVPEWLRVWCEREGRTPRPDEQAAIAREQTRRIEQACAEHDWVVADTTALMTAVYSLHLFGDDSLMAEALDAQARYAVTLVTDNDLTWQADGIQRDGPQVREPVQRLLRGALDSRGLPWVMVRGTGPSRLQSALQAWRGLLNLA